MSHLVGFHPPSCRQITSNEGRTFDQSNALYKAIADGLGKARGFRPEDVFINVVDVRRENWSVGNGEAQYVSGEAAAVQRGGESCEISTTPNINNMPILESRVSFIHSA
jgi:hypothetical protein